MTPLTDKRGLQRGGKPTTLRDVANEAGIGLAAVSGVLNSTRSGTRVSPETRDRILRIAAELRYTPNKMARGLKSVRLNTIGISFQTIGHNIVRSPYSSAILQGVLDVVFPAGFNLVVVCKPGEESQQSVDEFRNQGIDGFLIVAPYPTSNMVVGLKELGIAQVVIASAAAEHSEVPSVNIDNKQGTRLVMDHLFSLGHRRIAHMTGNEQQADMAIRQDTFFQMMAQANQIVPPEYRLVGDYRQPASFYEQARQLLTLPEPPTAIFASGGDLIALEVLRAAQDLQIRVPHQLSVVGFDNFPGTANSNPPLTTVRQTSFGNGGKGNGVTARPFCPARTYRPKRTGLLRN